MFEVFGHIVRMLTFSIIYKCLEISPTLHTQTLQLSILKFKFTNTQTLNSPYSNSEPSILKFTNTQTLHTQTLKSNSSQIQQLSILSAPIQQLFNTPYSNSITLKLSINSTTPQLKYTKNHFTKTQKLNRKPFIIH